MMQMFACGLYFEFTKLKLRLTWVFVYLNLNLQSSDLHGSKNAQFGDYKHHKNTEKGLNIEKKWHPCLAASVRFVNLQVELYIQNNLIFAV